MSDPYASLASQDEDLQRRIADAMEARCLEPAQQKLRQDYLSQLQLPTGARAVELGSGTGHVTADLLKVTGVASALGIEPSQVMVDRARECFADTQGLSFQIGDAKATGLDDDSMDMVLMHTLLCHVPDPQEALHEAYRILKPGGVLAVCDGDYDTATAQIAEFDPLDQLVRFMIRQNVHNLWIMRQLTGLLVDAGFTLGARAGHGYVAESSATYFLTVIDRGADRMVETGLLFAATAEALKKEARARVAAHTFFGFMSYVSQIAIKP